MPRLTKQEAQKLLDNVLEQYMFYCNDGRLIQSMRDLQNALLNMADDTFWYHSNQEKNDFSNWIRDVIGDVKLARDLDKAKDRFQAQSVVAARIAFLEGKI